MILGIQLVTGIFLAIHYSGDSDNAFFSVRHIIRDVNNGWAIRIIHANGARIFFIFVYMHLFRGIYYSRYKLKHVWLIGVTILLVIMAAAFLGYVLPWGQISFWGATVITNLFSVIPYLGDRVVAWLWGGFSVGGPTLRRFFGFHFLAPFILVGLVLIHLIFLHERGSSNPLGLKRDTIKLKFNPYFIWKDLLGFLLFFILFLILTTLNPWLLGDRVNFVPANPLVTPPHIQPEWYFLFAYAILRSIPRKIGGVLALAGAVIIFYFLPLRTSKIFSTGHFSISSKHLFWWFVNLVILLTWVGARPVETPFLIFGQIFTFIYFLYFCLLL